MLTANKVSQPIRQPQRVYCDECGWRGATHNLQGYRSGPDELEYEWVCPKCGSDEVMLDDR